MATNIIVARGGVEYVPPISLAFWRWFTVFLILFPFFYYEILKNKKYIIGIGRLTKQKNFELMINFFKKISDTFPHLNLVIIGEGEDETRLKKLSIKLGICCTIFS